jgi:hypothetical protein
MFVSKAEALARLTSEENLLRDEVASSPSLDADKVLDQLDPEQKNPNDNRESFDRGSTSTPAEGDVLTREILEATGGRGDNPFFIPSLDKLDRLIHRAKPTARPAKYRNNIEAQAAIAETSVVLGSAAAARIFDLSLPQTNAYQHGMDGSHRYSQPGQPKKPELKRRIDKIKEQIALSGSLRLRRIVKQITPEKIEAVESPIELARLGRDVAAIIEKVQDKAVTEGPAAQFHIYRPEIHTEQHYTTVTVNQVVAPSE